MMRLLVDVMHVHWEEAWDLTTKCRGARRDGVLDVDGGDTGFGRLFPTEHGQCTRVGGGGQKSELGRVSEDYCRVCALIFDSSPCPVRKDHAGCVLQGLTSLQPRFRPSSLQQSEDHTV